MIYSGKDVTIHGTEIQTMAGDDTEVCGFIDAKIPNNMRTKKRSFSPWKVWRRHWCHIRKLGSNFGLEVLFDHGVGSRVNNDKENSIRIMMDSIVCRTESRSKRYAFGIFAPNEHKALLYLSSGSELESQRWMANIRQLLRPRRFRNLVGTFKVSMIDNAHSRSAGLTGFYGDLVVINSGVILRDPHTGQIVELLDWKETNSIHLACSGKEEDVKRICTIHTTKEFRCGVGELHIFCLEAPRLLLDLVRQGKLPRHRHSHLTQRPLSLSEGDLRLVVQQQQQKKNIKSEEKDEVDGQSKQESKNTREHENAMSNGFLTLRTGSEAKLIDDFEKDLIIEKIESTYNRRAVDNVYHSNPKTASEKMYRILSLAELVEPSLRRVSNISIGSGVYEEILDDVAPTRTRRVPSHLYEDPGELILNSKVKLQPPPLPPRQRCQSGSTRNGSVSDDGQDSESDTRSATPSMQEDATPTPEDIKVPESEPETRNQPNTANNQIDTSEYVQMSPRPQDVVDRDFQLQMQRENGYVVMR